MTYNIQRTYIPGSEWVYVKIYCSSISSNKILIDQLYKVVNYLKNKEKIKKWFFIRYSDPYFHIRLRLLVCEPSSIATTIEHIFKKMNPLVKNGTINKIQLDTYNRELERYGADLISLTESLFCADSMHTVEYLKIVQKTEKNEDFVWLSAVLFIHRFLLAFQLTGEQCFLLMKRMETSFWSEFRIDKLQANHLNSLYRNYKNNIEDLLENENNVIRRTLKTNLDMWEKELKPLVGTILKTIKAPDKLPIDSYIHMMMNRLIPSRNRQYELFVYSFLFNYYRSVNSRNRVSANK